MTLHADLESYLLLCLRLVVKSTFRGPRHLLLVFGGPWEQWLKHFWSCAGTIWISMASNQALRSRLISVQKIQKITKAMKMVAASRLRGAQTKAEGSRGISQPFVFLLGDLADVEGDKHMIVSISSDKGLCGAINSTSAKFSEAMFDIATARGKEAKFVIVGEKGRIELQRRHAKDIAISISEAQKVPISFTQASMMAEDIMKNVEFDVARLVFNRFRSALAYYPTVATDLSPEHLVEESDESKLDQLNRFEEEGEGGELRIEMMRNLSEFGLTAYLFNGMLENAASEMGARMTSMDNSTRNASEMLHKLHLKYNRERQAQITKELIEIISGAAALQDRED